MAASIDDLERLDVRAGTVVRCEPFPEARTPAYKLWIDFGPEVGTGRPARGSPSCTDPRSSCRQVLGVVNFRRQIGPFRSEVLTLGVYADGDVVVLVGPDRAVPDGSRLG
jgi:tRNA-binding protein